MSLPILYYKGPKSFTGTSVPWESVHPDDFRHGFIYYCYENPSYTSSSKKIFKDFDELQNYKIAEERKIWNHTEFTEEYPARFQQMTDAGKTDAINPSHYKQLLVITDTAGNHIDTLQWLEHLQYKPFWRNNMQAFVHAVRDMCGDKYLSRMGMKDEETQEMEKSLWYYKFATAVMKNNYKPIRVKDIESLLKA